MTSLLININCYKKTCGKCKHKEQPSNAHPKLYICKIFEKVLNIKGENLKGGLVFYRLKECIQAEKDYFELLLEGW